MADEVIVDGEHVALLPAAHDEVAPDDVDHVLERIAAQLDVRYLHRTAPGELSLPVHRAVSVATKQQEPGGFELYWIVAGLAALVLAVELMERISAVRRAREDLR